MPPLSLQRLKDTTVHELIEHFDEILAPYAIGANVTPDERMAIANRTIAEMPDIYAWANTVHTYFDWLTDREAQLENMKSPLYKEARQRRDAAERIASVCKMKYQAASRLVTIRMHEDEEKDMPRTRSPR